MEKQILTIEELKILEKWLNETQRKGLIEKLEMVIDNKRLTYKEQKEATKEIHQLLDNNYIALENVRKEIAKMEGQQ
jgi:hypothetical protein